MLSARGRKVLVAATIVLPWSLRRRLYIRLLGWRLAPSARIGLSYIDAAHVAMAEGSWIGHLNVVRNLPLLQMGEDSAIGQWNWLASAEVYDSAVPPTGGFRGLKMAGYTAISSRHYLDCSGGITMGTGSMLAGVRSTLLTHQIDVAAGTSGTSPIEIGEYSLVSSNVKITPGALVPARCLVAMGAVVTGRLQEEGALYAGVPARVVRRDIGSGRFFSRVRGFVSIAPGESRRPAD